MCITTKCVLIALISAMLFGSPITYAQATAKKVKAQQTKQATPVTQTDRAKSAPLPQVPASFAPVLWSEGLSTTEYLRNEPPKVFEWVEAQIKSVPGKIDQYSTREERQQYESALIEKMKSVGQLAFVANCQKKYDADRQAFEIKNAAFAIKDLLLKDPNPEALKLRKLIIARTNVKKETYTAQNAYSATTEVIRDVSDDYVLAYPSGPYSEPSTIVIPGSSVATTLLPYRYNFIYYSVTLPMPTAEAREKDKDIACLSIFTLEPPYVFKFRERDSPTRDSPFDRTTNGFAFYGKLDHLWVINKSSGEVFSKNSRNGL